jgi:predicted ArsR family transcriptional regulator
MQQTRRYILDILKTRGEATVDEIVEELQQRRGKDITAVTVRHHITCLQRDNLIASPQLRHRDTPGRPQHVYSLTEAAAAQFPNNYQELASGLLQVMQEHLPPEGVNVILEGVARQMASAANIPDLPLAQRLDMAVEFLCTRGYQAYWESDATGFILHTDNCPYHQVAQHNHALCEMDMRLIATLLGVVPRRLTHVAAGDSSCAYRIPNQPLE